MMTTGMATVLISLPTDWGGDFGEVLCMAQECVGPSTNSAVLQGQERGECSQFVSL
jgi:hypothetical protein